MKKLLLTLFLFVVFQTLKAQSEVEKPILISAGIGVPNTPRFFFNYLKSESLAFKSTGVGPYHFKVEYQPKWWLGLGLNINHMQYTVEYDQNIFDSVLGKFTPNTYKIESKNTAFNARINFHFFNPENFEKSDLYFGLGMGYRTGSFKISSKIQGYEPKIKLPNFLKLGFETTLGYRYFFTENIGLFSELGIAKSVLQLGTTIRF